MPKTEEETKNKELKDKISKLRKEIKDKKIELMKLQNQLLVFDFQQDKETLIENKIGYIQQIILANKQNYKKEIANEINKPLQEEIERLKSEQPQTSTQVI